MKNTKEMYKKNNVESGSKPSCGIVIDYKEDVSYLKN
jgi:hypothetical protein